MKTKNRVLTTTIMLIAILMASVPAKAADAVATLDVVSAYVWRGITFNDGLVAQPSIDVTAGGFNINVWGNMDLDDYNGILEKNEFSEIDITLSYSIEVKSVSIGLGMIEYLFPAGGPGTREAFLSASMAPFAGFTISLGANYDFDEVKDLYTSLGLAYGLEITPEFSAELGVTVGYAGKDASAGDDGGLHDYAVSFSVGYNVSEALSVSAFVTYTNGFDEKVLPEQDVDIFGGIGISFAM